MIGVIELTQEQLDIVTGAKNGYVLNKKIQDAILRILYDKK